MAEQSASYLDDFMNKPNPQDLSFPKQHYERLDPRQKVPERVLRNEIQRDPSHMFPPRTDILSAFMIPPSSMRDSGSHRDSPLQGKQ
mmetsp:Transcript_35512/g.32001  ORF Transcript_35512/g.32001 Transcript_35512/m.32001 type:complete len:87 (+) Transcript_35512:448-708(+)